MYEIGEENYQVHTNNIDVVLINYIHKYKAQNVGFYDYLLTVTRHSEGLSSNDDYVHYCWILQSQGNDQIIKKPGTRVPHSFRLNTIHQQRSWCVSTSIIRVVSSQKICIIPNSNVRNHLKKQILGKLFYLKI
jgi:hypothetical protein